MCFLRNNKLQRWRWKIESAMMDVAIIPLNCVDVQEFRIESMIISYYLPMEKDDEKYEK